MVNPAKLGAAAVFLIAANAASAQETPLLDYVLESCATELEEYCSTVTPGDGRLLLCAAAHEDKLSSQCTLALYQASVIMQELTNTIAYLAESCATDIEEYCAESNNHGYGDNTRFKRTCNLLVCHQKLAVRSRVQKAATAPIP
jgi:Golgi apparatus protein 1